MIFAFPVIITSFDMISDRPTFSNAETIAYQEGLWCMTLVGYSRGIHTGKKKTSLYDFGDNKFQRDSRTQHPQRSSDLASCICEPHKELLYGDLVVVTVVITMPRLQCSLWPT